jgi:hypothetical protein
VWRDESQRILHTRAVRSKTWEDKAKAAGMMKDHAQAQVEHPDAGETLPYATRKSIPFREIRAKKELKKDEGHPYSLPRRSPAFRFSRASLVLGLWGVA